MNPAGAYVAQPDDRLSKLGLTEPVCDRSPAIEHPWWIPPDRQIRCRRFSYFQPRSTERSGKAGEQWPPSTRKRGDRSQERLSVMLFFQSRVDDAVLPQRTVRMCATGGASWWCVSMKTKDAEERGRSPLLRRHFSLPTHGSSVQGSNGDASTTCCILILTK